MSKIFQLYALLLISLSCLKNNQLKEIYKVFDNSTEPSIDINYKDSINDISSKIESKYKLSLAENNEKTPLIITLAKRGYRDLLKLLIRSGISIETQDENGNNALITASYYNNIGVVEDLIKNKVDIKIKNNRGFTPLLVAIQQSNIDVVKYLLNEGADINAVTLKYENALTIALEKESSETKTKEIIDLILNKGFDINGENDKGETALFISTLLMNEYLFRTLLEKGADIEHITKEGKTCLMYLCRDNNIKLLKILLDFNPKLDTQDYEGKSALYYALKNDSEDIFNTIISRGASLVECKKTSPLAGINYFIEKYKKLKRELELKPSRSNFFTEFNDNDCFYGSELRHCFYGTELRQHLSGYQDRDELNFTKLAVKCDYLLEFIQQYYPIDFLKKEIKYKAFKLSNNLKFEVLLCMLKLKKEKVEESEFKSVLFLKIKELKKLLVNEFILNEKYNEEKIESYIKTFIHELL